MSIEIYYFSGTGNSLAVARDIAARTEGVLRSIPILMQKERIRPAAEAIGLVYPVYNKGIPLILKRFVEKLEDLEGKYLFSACTYGDTTGFAIRNLRELIEGQGGELAAGFAVQMPYNYLTPTFALRDFYGSFTLREIPLEKQRELFAAEEERVESIAAYVKARESGTFETNVDILTRIADHFDLEATLAKTTWLKIAGVHEPTELSFLESRQLMDRAFHADESCNGCGTCVRVCPVQNISLDEGQPLWHQRCEQCFACLQWCPQQALQFGEKTAGRKRYHHPEVKLADIIKAAPQG